MSHLASSTDRVTVLAARRTDGWTTSHELKAGESVLVGTDDQCRLRLTGVQLSPKHCLVRFVDGELSIQDWCSDMGTIVNGRAIDSIVSLSPDADIEIGEYSLQLQTEQPQCLHGVESSVALPSEDDVSDLSNEVPSWEPRLPKPPQDSSSPVDGQWNDTQSDAGVDLDTYELLRAEVEFLQGELDERDAKVSELSKNSHSTYNSDKGEEDANVVDERLRVLLDELDQNDQRISALEQALRASEEALLAEMEERRQVDAWVRDIEDRFGQREAEWTAEQEALKRRSVQITQERDRLLQRFHQAADASGVDPALKDLIATLQSEKAALDSRLLSEEARSRTLANRCEELQAAASENYQQQQIDDAIRAERLQVAQERAELSRLRSELASQLHEAQRNAEQEVRVSTVDQRFRVFRQHLQEIHEIEKSENNGATLSARLARLWRRLDGPTDTD